MGAPRSGGLVDGQLTSGTQLGRYKILSHLATGGMAEIFLAKAKGIQGFERLVVVKKILPHWARDPAFIEMFLDEARLAAMLQHPAIAQVFDIGEHEGSYFFTMEFVHGADTRRMFRKTSKAGTRIPIEHTLHIVMQAAGALHYAHELRLRDGQHAGIVHRDVSPSNILVTYDGAVKVVDFGVAKAAGRQRETSTGTLKGKVSYMSPEQCMAKQLDRRSDVFALGIVLYELLTGSRLFEGDSDLLILNQIASGVIERPSSLSDTSPRTLDEIVLKALAKNPDERFQTAEELQIALEEFAQLRGLLTSQRNLGEYMKELFPAELGAWESAQRQGKSLAAHLAESSVLDVTPSGLKPHLPTPSGIESPYASVTMTEDREPEIRAAELEIAPHRDWLKWVTLLSLSILATVLFIRFGLPALSGSDEKPAQTATEPAPAAEPAQSDVQKQLEELREQAAQEKLELEAARKAAAEERAALEALRKQATSRPEPTAAPEPETKPEPDKPNVVKKSRSHPKTKTKTRTKTKSKTGDNKRNANSPFLPSQRKKP